MIVDYESVEALCDRLRQAGKQIVLTNGCFDILHAGHVRYLTAARRYGDLLIVGLNSDASVKGIKGDGRPVNGEADRAEVLDGLKAVDYVVIFAEPTAAALAAKVKPEVYVKGGDYTVDELPEARVVADFGGRTELVPLVAGRSSTNVINRIKLDSGAASS